MSNHLPLPCFILSFVLSLFLFVGAAFAWHFTLSGVDGDLTAGENYTMTVAFEGVATDYLDLLAFAIEWDTEKLALAGFVEVPTYTRSPGFPDPDYNLFQPTFISPIPDIPNGRYYDVNGECTLDHKGEFFPEASSETLVATFTFEALATGSFTDLAGFYFTPENDLTELVNINGVTYNAQYGELQITKEGGNSILKAQYYLMNDIGAQTTNISTPTDPIVLTISANESGRLNITASSSDTDLVPNDSIQFFSDDQGTPLSNPLDVTAGTPVTLYMVATPANPLTGIAIITVTVTDHAVSSKTASTDFDLTVEMGGDGKTNLNSIFHLLLGGHKARGSRILLTGVDDPEIEIVGYVNLYHDDQSGRVCLCLQEKSGIPSNIAPAFSKLSLPPGVLTPGGNSFNNYNLNTA